MELIRDYIVDLPALFARLELRIYAMVASGSSYFIDSGIRRHANASIPSRAVACTVRSQRYTVPTAPINSTYSHNYMYAICTSHARKDHQKKSDEKAGRTEGAGSERGNGS